MKFQAVAEKTAKDARGLLYFAAPGRATKFGMVIGNTCGVILGGHPRLHLKGAGPELPRNFLELPIYAHTV